MATVLLVLKIIGIVLLCILLFVIGFIILLLALPFRYKVIAKKTECDSDKITDALKAEVHITWLLHLIHLGVIYEKKTDLWLKVLGIKFFKKNLLGDKRKEEDEGLDFPDEEYFGDDEIEAEDPKDSGNKSDKQSDEDDKSKSKVLNKLDQDFKESKDNEKSDSEKEVDDNVKSVNKSDEVYDETDFSDSDDFNKENESKEKSDIFDRIEDFLENLSDKTEIVLEKTENFLSKPEEAADKIIDTYDYYSHLLGTKGAEISIEFLKTELIKILKSLKPTRGYVEFDFASTDPEKTAKIYEIYGSVLAFLPKKSKIYIDSEDDHLYFDIRIKGNIYLGFLIFHGLKILLNKRLKKFIKLLKREEK